VVATQSSHRQVADEGGHHRKRRRRACYTKQEDGTESDWGQILEWDPPNRFVMAWQITHEWGYEPDLAKSSEVEIRFTAQPGGGTRVDLEHRHFERMGPAGDTMREGVGGPGGVGRALLDLSKPASRNNLQWLMADGH
jgi:Activator of Hsp90 ATPase homolog 1-like protein.